MTERKERVVVVGAAGMLGRAWCELLTRRGVPLRALGRQEVDITDAASIRAAVPADAGVLVNCAAYTDVDGAEADEDAAVRLNGDAVGLLAEQARRVGATLVHYSTDYVFSGRASEPYPVDAPIEPVNAYGRSKAAGEAALRASGAGHLLVRTSWLYAPWAKNFVRTMLRLAASRDSLQVVDDQKGRPTSAEHLAAVSLALLEAGQRGIFHVTDGGMCTWFEFASRIVAEAGLTCRVQRCSTAEFPTPARRPAYSVLDLSGTERVLGPLPPWQDNLREVVGRVEPASL